MSSDGLALRDANIGNPEEFARLLLQIELDKAEAESRGEPNPFLRQPPRPPLPPLLRPWLGW